VAAARAGDLPEGRRLLEAALAAAPGDRAALADLVVVLSWAGRDREALARFETLPAPPAHAITAAAVSARRSGQAARAVALYRRAIAAGDTATETRLGLALAEAARGDRAAASAAIAAAEAADSGNPRIAQVATELARPRVQASAADLARIDALLETGRGFDALERVEAALRLAPRDLGLRRREALALAAVGAPELALVRGAGTLTGPEARRIRGAANAFLVRWGTQVESPTPNDPVARHARTDAALAALDAAIAAWLPLGPEAAGAVRNARIDRLVALRDRGRVDEVLAEAAVLSADGPLPGYAREAVGDALMNRRRPEEAEQEYRAALEADPGALNPSLGLFYALSERRRWAEARAVVDRLERDTPAFRPVRGPEPPVPEWDRIEAVTSDALWRMWGDDLAGAEAVAGPLAAAAPMNSSLRALRGDIWRMRGWTSRSIDEYEAALTNAPDALDLRIGLAEALFDARRWPEARLAAATLAAQHPENAAVRRLARRIVVHDMRLLEVVVTGGLNRTASTPELDIAARLWSAPIAEHYRVFGGALMRTGDTSAGDITAWRGTAGVEWRRPGAIVTGGVSLDHQGVDRGGAFLRGVFRLSDHWSIEADGELTAADTPLAALTAGIHADAAGAAIVWRASDLREAAASFRAMRFSDDNVRLIGFARWQERVMNLPDWKLDLQPYAYGTSNSVQGAPYFNPERDLETAVTAALTWFAWKRYERELRVRFVATAGGYWQENFGWSPLVALRWENQHVLSDTFSVAYGAGWVSRDYDGRRENGLSVTGLLRWRF
jgi:biofilm PGA synthesis protein PgaA